MKINWLPKAVRSFFQIGDYLEENFGPDKTDEFIGQVEKTIERIETHPHMYKASGKNKSARKGFVNQFVSLFYKVKPRKKEIDLLEFWHNKQDPEKLKH